MARRPCCPPGSSHAFTCRSSPASPRWSAPSLRSWPSRPAIRRLASRSRWCCSRSPSRWSIASLIRPRQPARSTKTAASCCATSFMARSGSPFLASGTRTCAGSRRRSPSPRGTAPPARSPMSTTSTWRLNLPPRSLTYAELLAVPSQQQELTLECISNDVGGTLISNGIWKGPRVTDVLALTTVPSDAVWMLMESADGYTESFHLRELTPDHLLATHLNGAPLTPQHGFPARFLFPGHYGMKQPKWVTRIRFSASDQPGYWENNGWDELAIVKTMSRIDRPADGTALAAGSIQFGGIAFAGSRRIGAVELSWDNGRGWQAAGLPAEFAPHPWRFWQLTTSLPAGHYGVSVRARDGEGTLQTSKTSGTLPNGADGYHSITLVLP